MERAFEEKRDLTRKILWGLVAVFVVMTLAILVLGAAGLQYGYLVAGAIMSGLYMYLLWRFFSDKRGYQDRYQNQGASAMVNQNIFRAIMMVVYLVLLYFVLRYILIELDLYFPGLALLATIFIGGGTVQYADYRAAKPLKDYVEYKDKKHKDFVESLGKAEGLCMSCRKKIEPGTEHCPFCGFKQKKSKDSSYAGKQ